jgi:hypothetical protein
MKRLTLLTILLVVVGLTAGFALDVKPTAELSGYGKVEWGIDLNTMYTGFLNTAEADLTVSLLAEDNSDTHKGDGDWYGWIEISDVELFWTRSEAEDDGAWNADDLGVEAKIVGLGGKLAIGVYGDPDLGSNTDFVAAIEDDEDGDYNVLDDETSTESDLGVDWSGYGTYASYSLTDNLMVGLELVSYDSWDRSIGDFPWEAYAAALDVMAKFAPITVTAGVNYGIVGYTYPPAAYDLGFGVKVAADTDMVDAWVGFDGGSGATFAFEVGGGATVTLMEGVTADVAVTYGTGKSFDGYDDLDVEFILTEPQAKGLVDNLDLTVSVWVLDLLAPSTWVSGDPGGTEWEVTVDGGYKMGDLYPNFCVDVGDDVNLGLEPTWDDPVTTPLGKFMNVTVGIDYTGIPMTTLGLYYKNNDFWATPIDKGDIIVSAKVAY